MGSLMAGWDSPVPDPKSCNPLDLSKLFSFFFLLRSLNSHGILLISDIYVNVFPVTYQRNWSFTKGEIEAYWALKKKTEEEHLKAISSLSDHSKV